MKILTVGDSFTYGEELDDLACAWPHLLAQKLNGTATNLGQPGSGNNNIVRKVVTNADSHDLVIVAWSHFARIEFADEQGIYDTWPGARQLIFSDRVGYRSTLVEYISRHHSDKYLYNQQLLNIILLQRYLTSLNKPYIMVDTFGNNQSRALADSTLVEQIDGTHYLGWPTETMMEWTWGCEHGRYGHFLNEGHERVANKIYEFYTRN